MSENTTFRSAKPWGWVIRAVQTFLRFELSWRNRLHLDQRDLEVFRRIPQKAGIILTPNHADETDFKVCLELSRRTGRRFLFMMNREAFQEGHGTAGWWLQRLGSFSVDRGGQNEQAKRYAIDIVKRAEEVLVIFPEGEIYYLNDLVQPFKSGAVDIGMQAVVEARETRPDWTAYLVPLALKYRYRRPIGLVLEQRVRRMERHLSWRKGGLALQQRLARIVAELLHRQEIAHQLQPDSDGLNELSDRVQQVRQAVLSQIEGRYSGSIVKPLTQTMDRAWRLSFYLRNMLIQGKHLSTTIKDQIQKDLAALKHVAHMAGWQPEYVEVHPSQERLAETVLNLEREVYQVKRPHQLGDRGVFLRIGEPIDLGHFVSAYLQDAQTVRHCLAEQLRDRIQDLINSMVTVTPATKTSRPNQPEGGSPDLVELRNDDDAQGSQ